MLYSHTVIFSPTFWKTIIFNIININSHDHAFTNYETKTFRAETSFIGT